MRIAVIGSGISGMVCSYLLHPGNELTVFEANDYAGGHANTAVVTRPTGELAIDTGFICYNERNYPHFTRLLSRLAVDTQPTTMSFSVQCKRSNVEYSGESIRGLFAQAANLLRPSFYQMVRDILRFNRQAVSILERTDDGPTLGEFLRAEKYSQPFMDRYLVPMASAIWSSEPGRIGDFPAKYFVLFFRNHGLLTVADQPIWRTIVGGSKEYVRKLTASFRSRIRFSTPIRAIQRDSDGVNVEPVDGAAERFDKVILAVHGDQALKMLADPSPDEREILQAFAYQANDTVLHSQSDLLPKRRSVWASWNYHIPAAATSRCTVTYNMNKLQQLASPTETFCVTLNRTNEIQSKNILGRYQYEHPIYSKSAFASQPRWESINGLRNTYYCGAYWGYGFHEDGVRSALRVAEMLGRTL